MLRVDAALGPVSVMFSTAREPIAAAASARACGTVALARQVTAPPQQYARELPVSRTRRAEIMARHHPCVVCACLLPVQGGLSRHDHLHRGLHKGSYLTAHFIAQRMRMPACAR